MSLRFCIEVVVTSKTMFSSFMLDSIVIIAFAVKFEYFIPIAKGKGHWFCHDSVWLRVASVRERDVTERPGTHSLSVIQHSWIKENFKCTDVH